MRISCKRQDAKSNTVSDDLNGVIAFYGSGFCLTKPHLALQLCFVALISVFRGPDLCLGVQVYIQWSIKVWQTVTTQQVWF